VGNGLSAYRDALDYLFVRTTGQWKFGLERTCALLDALGNPHRALRVIHVGGTNGKGSVCATMDRVLRDRGFCVARYTSPHLVDFRERMTIDGAPVAEDAIVAFVEQWTPTIERLGATFFEATTAMAFALFAEANPDIALVEVGLGGRLDSTNVVDPMMAIVTGVGIDHTEYLGETRAEIAVEKAGIFKPDRPAVIGESDMAIRKLLAQHARAAHAAPVDIVHDVVRIGDVSVDGDGTAFTMLRASGLISGRTALIGRHQADNAAVALRALEMLPPPFTTSLVQSMPSLPHVTLPGRFHVSGKFIFDVAHNRDGAAVCAAALTAVSPARPRVAVLSVLGDKDWRGMMDALAPEVDRFVLTLAPTSPQNRKWNPDDAMSFARQRGWDAAVERDFDAAIRRADAEGRTVLVTGSFHTVGDAMARLHVSPHGG
jgi:dihydrofolate synthase/folylpolyglutamate synthase